MHRADVVEELDFSTDVDDGNVLADDQPLAEKMRWYTATVFCDALAWSPMRSEPV